MKNVTLITEKDFKDTDFEVKGKKVQLRRKVVKYTLEYTVGKDVVSTQNERQRDDDFRHLLSVVGVSGIVHLDFMPKVNLSTSHLIFRLPKGAPRPLSIIEYQARDGSSCWLDTSGNVYANSMKKDTRYIFDLVGFFG